MLPKSLCPHNSIDFLLVKTSPVAALGYSGRAGKCTFWPNDYFSARTQRVNRGGMSSGVPLALSITLFLSLCYRWANWGTAERKKASSKGNQYGAGDGGICCCSCYRLPSPKSCFCSRDAQSHKISRPHILPLRTRRSFDCQKISLSIQSEIAYVEKENFKAKLNSISREPRFVFFVRLKPQVREGNVVGIISHNGWYKSKEKNNSSTLKQLI